MNLGWFIGLLITETLSCLALVEFPLEYRIGLAIGLALFLFIIYLANLAYKLKISNNKKSKEITQKDDELSNIKQEIKKINEKQNELSNINCMTYEIIPDEPEQNIKIYANTKTELVAQLEAIPSGTKVIIYEDDEREATVKKYLNEELWEFYYYRRGFRTTIRDFSLHGVIKNEYFNNVLSWIKIKD